ncbi:MAG TPA: DUF5994 family protein [Nocardioidaceae bacterium]|nr:DUF5994 family protein [Nocardioidaceae bacterium]
MTTSNETRVPLRLRLSPAAGRGALDGAWWPQSRDLETELADLVDHYPVTAGRVVRAVYSRPDWSSTPRRVAVKTGAVKTGSYPQDDSHRIMLGMSGREIVQLLVVPPDTAPERASAVMRVAATPTNRRSATEILESDLKESDLKESGIREPGIREPGEESAHWNDDGGSWWDPNPVPPSQRAGT